MNVETGTLQILDDIGAPLVVNQVGGTADSSFKYSIPSGGAFRFQTDGFPASTKVGWVQLTPDAGTSTPVGAGMFSYNPENVLVTNPESRRLPPLLMLASMWICRGGHDTGLAIANPQSTSASITIKAFQTDGVTGLEPVRARSSCQANGHSAKFADEFIAGFAGRIYRCAGHQVGDTLRGSHAALAD